MIRSEYEKKQEETKKGKEKQKSSEKGKAPDQSEIDEKELSSKISEAEALDLCMLDTEEFAQELTQTEVKILMDITPVEILKFSYDNEAEMSPTFVGYMKFTDALSAYVATSILDCQEAQSKASSGRERRQFHAQSEMEAAQAHWKDVMEKLLDRNNLNSLNAIFRGLMKTSPARILKEQILDLYSKASENVSQSTEKDLQVQNMLYIRDVKTLEKHLIDASYNQNDKDTPAKFRRIIEYLNYVRAHSSAEIDEKINHAIISTLRNTKDIRISAGKTNSVFFSGCFLFLEHSSYISLE
ncbi:hypothetical protein NEAUS04_0852 [Nematocida ausubeli]|uniref:Ras-GEF domain-containing protein n=1 Tax=Nematocida ausubeli (strain ATCC PRA-371 / ERTm2) TaxID=1913371 RepID=H8ZDX2_NEMA1|nr:uncharacterized protein NESG_00103 [Nematocida ausubeli]EHY65347.1 hypothetical protein NERG_01793 [Nematocida ausubeli]KAI5132453.1 hypothetical protein NEAUS06_0148 [Nematocida ausubeli]KAI5132777.1 hypothetical protein NEAUS07_0285 [Nematocida ausubeli]KAI5147899.1 hypothetical protein NEAUS05_1174 [Nematocida ausubeli]KAI5162065.1 hypothetical protein NEAUS04_0852 [Nematocida ausubeli]